MSKDFQRWHVNFALWIPFLVPWNVCIDFSSGERTKEFESCILQSIVSNWIEFTLADPNVFIKEEGDEEVLFLFKREGESETIFDPVKPCICSKQRKGRLAEAQVPLLELPLVTYSQKWFSLGLLSMEIFESFIRNWSIYKIEVWDPHISSSSLNAHEYWMRVCTSNIPLNERAS